jgi:hypothetical protein
MGRTTCMKYIPPLTYEDSTMNQEFLSRDEDLSETQAPKPTSTENKHTLSVGLSESLYRKLAQKAHGEGVSLEEMARELLAEGVVLRAWEILERKMMMRTSGNSHGGFQQSEGRSRGPSRNPMQSSGMHNKPRNGGGSFQGGANPSAPRRPSPTQYRNILEDSANFIEYVRSQERKK